MLTGVFESSLTSPANRTSSAFVPFCRRRFIKNTAIFCEQDISQDIYFFIEFHLELRYFPYSRS